MEINMYTLGIRPPRKKLDRDPTHEKKTGSGFLPNKIDPLHLSLQDS